MGVLTDFAIVLAGCHGKVAVFAVDDSSTTTEWSPGRWWAVQGLFWLCLSAITFLTLTVWYATIEWPHVLHTLLQGVMGLALSWPLHRILQAAGTPKTVRRAAIVVTAVAGIALVWTLARMVTFMWMTGATGLWADFGGWYFGAIFIFLCWGGLHYTIHYYRLLQVEQQKVLKASARSLQAEALAKEAQLKMLRYQLNPHFLFNTLNAVAALVRLGDARRSQEMIARLARFLRYSLDSDPLDLVPLETELDMLRLYLDIELTRFGERLKIYLDIGDEARSALVPSLFLQPLAENSIKYAIAPCEEGGSLSVAARVVDETLRIEVSDTGSGLRPQDLRNGRGVGLKNTRERLDALYGDNHTLKFTQRGERLVVGIALPYRCCGNARQRLRPVAASG